jgi:hypothetical protein
MNHEGSEEREEEKRCFVRFVIVVLEAEPP